MYIKNTSQQPIPHRRPRGRRLCALGLVALVVLRAAPADAQQVLTLDECHRRALADNKGLKMANEKRAETSALEKAALWQMLPKVSANGGYLWMDRNPSLLSGEQQNTINNMGTAVQGNINQQIIDALGAAGISGQALTDAINCLLSDTRLEQGLNNVGHQITDALELDMNSLCVGAVTVTQPIYMGGKLVALHRTAALMNELSEVEYDKQREATLIAVDEAYWTVVSVKHKKELAEQYTALLQTLTDNVEEMVNAEVATTGDLARVRVKLNEAQMNLTKATNGLALAKMLLAQRCGIPLNESSNIDVEEIGEVALRDVQVGSADMERVLANRNEMKMLRISDSVAQQGVRVAASTLKPNIVATGGYLVSNPNLFDGFKNEFSGTLTAGVAVNMPLLHPGGIYALRAAKHKRQEVAYQMAEAEEMIELQVNKLQSELQLAYSRLVEAQSAVVQAEENLRLADESFKAGVCSSSDLMAAQTAWKQAKGEVIDARIEIEMGKLYLKQALGE